MFCHDTYNIVFIGKNPYKRTELFILYISVYVGCFSESLNRKCCIILRPTDYILNTVLQFDYGKPNIIKFFDFHIYYSVLISNIPI